MVLGPVLSASFTRDGCLENGSVLVKLAATELGGNGRRTKHLENTRHKMRDAEREIGLRLVIISKSKSKALAKKILSLTVGFTSLEWLKRRKMLLQLNVSSALCVSVKLPSRSWSVASRLFSVCTGINPTLLCCTVLSSLNPRVGYRLRDFFNDRHF